MQTLEQYLHNVISAKKIELFFDIETFMYNESNGRHSPSEYKNMTFSVAVSWLIGRDVEYQIFNNFKQLFDTIIKVFKQYKKYPSVELNAHNTNKYDNHFLRKDLLYYYDMKVENYYLMTGTTDESNKDSLRIKDLTSKDKEGIILEKRVKSSINLELIFFLEGIKFQTVDNWVKTNSSIKMLGDKMKNLGVVSDDELKTDFDYLKYNLDKDMSPDQARQYSMEIFNQLSDEELQYIRNDVILLAKSVYYYSDIFNNFKYSKPTFTSNILESYNTNNLTSFQLLNRVGKGREKEEIRYTDYQFSNQNLYDYLKPFYRGGLNFYNQFYIGKIIDDGMFSMDINSSYPYAMHNFKIPTYISDFKEFEHETYTSIHIDDDTYTIYQMSKENFDHIILSKIDSIILRQILVKYYSTNEFVNVNSYTFRMIENITGIKIDSIPVFSFIVFETEYFGSRDMIEEFYRIKTQGKQNKKIKFNSPYDIELTDQDNDEVFSQEEIDNSKVNLNGLYGIPALRPYFNLFRRTKDGELYNVENGHKNNERNIVFSIFVTSVSLWNLLSPLKFLSSQEIDENFIYCDTDSLYFKSKVRNRIPDEFFHPFHLGKWDLENEYIDKFYVLNHKKYCYEVNGKINVRSGGVPHSSFNTDMDFETFVDTQFSDGVEINTLKSIYNKDETISIYPSKTLLEIGSGYRIRSNSSKYDEEKAQIFKEVREFVDEFTNDMLYVESTIGTFSISDVFPVTHEVKNKKPLVLVKITQEKFKRLIEQE